MSLYILFSIIVVLLMVGIAMALVIATRKSMAHPAVVTDGKYPRGYWMSVGISLGIGIGTALGIALENIGIGIALGTAIGAGIGASLEQKNKDKARPLTEQEQQIQRRGVILGVMTLLVLAGILVLVLFLRTG